MSVSGVITKGWATKLIRKRKRIVKKAKSAAEVTAVPVTQLVDDLVDSDDE